MAACAHAQAPLPPDVAAGQAALLHAEELERAGQYREAALEYERVAQIERSTLGRDPARGLARAAELWADKLSDPARAQSDCELAIRRYPDAAPADDAVRLLVRLRPPQLRERLLALARSLDRHEVVDNLQFEAAALIEQAAPAQARAEYEALAHSFPHSGLRDDALWRAAHIARAQRDGAGAMADLYAITAQRRQPLLVGTYNSTWRDQAQLEIGRIWLEDRHDARRAVAAFELLRDEMTESTLRDDAQMWIARAWAAASERIRACEALARLRRDFPESRYLRKDAPALFAELGCR